MRRHSVRRLCVLALAGLALTGALSQAQVAAPETPASAAKDIVVDGPASSAAPAAPAVPAVPAVAAASQDMPANTDLAQARRRSASPALADLGLHLLRQQARLPGHARSNAVLSPYSVGIALGMLHAGAVDSTAAEIAGVLEPTSSGARLLSSGLGHLPQAIRSDGSSQWFAPSRLWLGRTTARELSAVYAQRLASDFGADGVLVDFDRVEAARETINGWAGEATQQRITQVLPAASLRSSTRMVLTNAAWFKGRWSAPFPVAGTQVRPFHAEDGTRDVPTMHGVLNAREGVLDNVYVLELGFEGGGFSMLLAMPPRGHSLQALEDDLMGADIAAWTGALKPQRIALALPKFEIQGSALPLNDALRAAGMRQAFGDAADFSGIAQGKGLAVDSIFHSAAIRVDEAGTEASAATAATLVPKSLSLQPAVQRAFDRPFLFVLLHRPTGTPLFVGRVASPA